MEYVIYRNTETNDIWALYEVEKPYLCGINTGMHCKLLLVCTADKKNPMETMTLEQYKDEGQGYEDFSAYIFSEGIDEAAAANDYEKLGDFDKLMKDENPEIQEILKVIKAFFKSRYGVDY